MKSLAGVAAVSEAAAADVVAMAVAVAVVVDWMALRKSWTVVFDLGVERKKR